MVSVTAVVQVADVRARGNAEQPGELGGAEATGPQDAFAVLFSRTGALVGIRAQDWRDGRRFVREVLLAVPAHLHTYMPDRVRLSDPGEE